MKIEFNAEVKALFLEAMMSEVVQSQRSFQPWIVAGEMPVTWETSQPSPWAEYIPVVETALEKLAEVGAIKKRPAGYYKIMVPAEDIKTAIEAL